MDFEAIVKNKESSSWPFMFMNAHYKDPLIFEVGFVNYKEILIQKSSSVVPYSIRSKYYYNNTYIIVNQLIWNVSNDKTYHKMLYAHF